MAALAAFSPKDAQKARRLAGILFAKPQRTA